MPDDITPIPPPTETKPEVLQQLRDSAATCEADARSMYDRLVDEGVDGGLLREFGRLVRIAAFENHIVQFTESRMIIVDDDGLGYYGADAYFDASVADHVSVKDDDVRTVLGLVDDVVEHLGSDEVGALQRLSTAADFVPVTDGPWHERDRDD